MESFVIDNLDKIPYKLLRKKNSKKTIILLSGTGGNFEQWDEDKPLEFYRQRIMPHWCDAKKYEHLIKKGKSNFQKHLSKFFTTFSFTPFEYIKENIIEENKTYQTVEPNKYFYDIKQIVFTMKQLILKFKLTPPFIFVGFSEGGWRALIMQEHIPNTEKCVLIDPQRFNKSSPENKYTYNSYKLLKKHGMNYKLKDDPKYLNPIIYYKYNNLIKKYILKKIKSKIIIFMNFVEVSDNNKYTDRFLSEIEYINTINNLNKDVIWNFYFDKIHMLHWMYYNDIINAIIYNTK